MSGGAEGGVTGAGLGRPSNSSLTQAVLGEWA